jgi:RNA polymerase sigma-70 factor (ECF subfamily)
MDAAPPTTTTALLHLLRGGHDAEVWDDFVARYGPILRGVAWRLGLSADDAADAAQQTLLEFVRDMRAGRFDRSRGKLRTWILAIAEHRCRDLQRRARTRESAGAPWSDAEACTAVLEAYWDEEERAQIAAAAWAEVQSNETADSTSLQAFELTAIREVPAAEVAKQLGMSVDAVYSAKYRIAQRLRASVERLRAAYSEDSA